jgi:hypothetical protein
MPEGNMNLIQELGLGYFGERFNRCMFFGPDGKACYILDANRSEGIKCAVVEGPSTKPVVTETYIPPDFFKDLSVFGVPALGWRSTAQGRYTVYMSRNNRSYHRGVSSGILNKFVAPSSELLIRDDGVSPEYYSRESTVVSMVMNPEFITMRDGIAAMADGSLYSFAISANLAVLPMSDESYGLYFNTNRVGSVSPGGNISCSIPVVRRLLEEGV